MTPDPLDNRLTSKGFTLVELMVASLLLGMSTIVFYALFQSSVRSMKETEQTSQLVEQARYALERVSGDLRGAGSFASPDSSVDPRVNPKPEGGNLRVVGVGTYQNDNPGAMSMIGDTGNWQDNTDGTGPMPTDVASANPMASFDGFVAMGAYQFPTSVEATANSYTGNYDGNFEQINMFLEDEERGLYRLLWNDPIRKQTAVQQGIASQFGGNQFSDIRSKLQVMNPLVRVLDRDGFFQFGDYSTNINLSNSPTQLGFSSFLGVKGEKGHEHGLEPADNTSDQGYNVSFVNAIWYYVEKTPGTEANFRLIRRPIDATAVAGQFAASNWNSITINGAGPPEPIIDNVVDFQVWFDCRTPTDETVNNVSWKDVEKWNVPSGTSTDNRHNCLDPANPQPQRLRVGHIRLAIRTDDERLDLEHVNDKLPWKTQLVPDTAPMTTFDVDPDSEGSARVVVVQTSLEMTNFAFLSE